jgi:hypothetical protein
VSAVRRTLLDGGPGTPAERRRSVLPYSWRSRAEVLMSCGEGPSPGCSPGPPVVATPVGSTGAVRAG